MTEDKQHTVRVLHLVNKWIQGGVERYIETLYGQANEDQFEFVVASITTPVESKIDCEKYGPIIANGTAAKELLSFAQISQFLRTCECDIVHIHSNNGTGYLFAHLAKKNGIPFVILHSHNSNYGPQMRWAKASVSRFLRRKYSEDVDIRFACSNLAGRHLFEDAPFCVVHNGINTSKFQFSLEKRDSSRRALSIPSDAIVVGFAASLIPVKNVVRAAAIFRSIRQVLANSFFVVLGDGEQREMLEKQISKWGIGDSCRLAGYVTNVDYHYSAFDVLLAPSLYEGLPINLVEAQASGCLIAASDAISEEVVLTDRCLQLPLSDSDDKWANKIISVLESGFLSEREAYAQVVKESGYDISESSSLVFEAYENMRLAG